MSKTELEIDQKIEEHKENCTKDFLRQSVFIWVVGIVITISLTIAGWLFYDVRTALAKVDNAVIENNKVQVQLSQIQTDVQWIKLELQRK